MRTFQEFAATDFEDVEMRRFDGAAHDAKQKLDIILQRLEELKSSNSWEASPKQFSQLSSELHAITNDMTIISRQ